MGTTVNDWNLESRASHRAERRLLAGSVLGMLAAIGLAIGMAQAARAATDDGHFTSDAEKLRRLDIMLMVTGLRCRSTSDNFMDDYGRFTARHMSELNGANSELRTQLAARFGGAGADRALDRMSVVMANEYGGGHPWLSCADLHQVTQDLVEVQGRATLVVAAEQLLDSAPRPLFALASPRTGPR